MLSRALCMVLVYFFMIPSISFAEKKYEETIIGCYERAYTASPPYYKIKDDNVDDWYSWKHYEIAYEDIPDSMWDKLNECSCENDNICRAHFIYTTDINDFDDKDSRGLIRKFTSLKKQ